MPATQSPFSVALFCIYAATGFAFRIGLKRRHDLLAIFLVIFSVSVEIAQLFVPGRHARLSDFIIDAVGACIGLVTSSLLGLTLSKRANVNEAQFLVDPSDFDVP
jgi:VanZ family protein